MKEFDYDLEWRAHPENNNYLVSNKGDILSYMRTVGGRVMNPSERRGYLYWEFGTVHKAVAQCFLGPRPSSWDVDHKDGNPSNNCKTNLRYLSRSENLRHIRNPIRLSIDQIDYAYKTFIEKKSLYFAAEAGSIEINELDDILNGYSHIKELNTVKQKYIDLGFVTI